MMRVGSLVWTFGAVVTIGCLSDSVSYSPQQDNAAFVAIASTWSTPGGEVTLSVCEDVQFVGEGDTCQTDHVVRGGGRGRRHEEDHGGVGCGGCPFQNVANVTGRISGGGLAPDTLLTGQVYLGREGNDPYGFPYDVNLSCMNTTTFCRVSASLQADGSLRLYTSPDGGVLGDAHMLTRVEAAACP